MDIKKVMELAKARQETRRKLEKDPAVKRVLATLVKVGLLVDQTQENPRITTLSIRDIFKAARAEPRVIEVLPALAYYYRIFIKDDKLPNDLEKVLEAYRKRQYLPYKWVEKNHIKWLDFHSPKLAGRLKTSIAEAPKLSLQIRMIRKKNGLTQKEFANIFNVSKFSLEKIEKGNLNVHAKALLTIQEIVKKAS